MDRPAIHGGAPLRSSSWLTGFVLVEMACQVALLLPSVAGLRVIVRTAAFAASLLLTFLLPGPRSEHPSRLFIVVALTVIGASVFHPTTNTLVAGLATLALNVAIAGPIFWVPRIRIDISTIRRLFFLFWAFHTASASLGVLQVYFPGQFQPAIASNLDDNYIKGLEVVLASGTRVLRPMGLTDTPGGAALGGVYSILFSSGFLLDRPRALFRTALLASISVGFFVLYLCLVRTMLVVLVIGLCGMIVPFVLQRRVGSVLRIALPVLAIGALSFSSAFAVGAETVTNRLETLFDSSPSQVYYSNRGIFLEHTFTNLLPEYPLGAGLGRWGMMFSYFGDPYNSLSPPLWAEIQWTAWLFDGGVVLMLLYTVALVLGLRDSIRSALRAQGGGELAKWAAVLVGYGVGVLAGTFDFCPFAGTIGLDFWLLNAAVFAASREMVSVRGEEAIGADRATNSRAAAGASKALLGAGSKA